LERSGITPEEYLKLLRKNNIKIYNFGQRKKSELIDPMQFLRKYYPWN
jgi:hypothetical protein